MAAHFLSELVPEPDAGWGIQDLSTGALLATRVIPAFDRQSRNRGLLNRAGLERGDALVLAPCSSIHTWFMRFPIDVLFVSRAGEVLKVKRAVSPWRLSARPGAFAVVELRAGGSSDVQTGNQLGVMKLEAGRTGQLFDRSRLPVGGSASDMEQKFVTRFERMS